MERNFILILMALLLAAGCEILDNDLDKHWDDGEGKEVFLDDVARLFSELPISTEQMKEVRDAVRSSSGNGYDEEYTMEDLFDVPGRGVGDPVTKAPGSYRLPLKEMLRQHVAQTKTAAGENGDILFDEEFLEGLMASDLQIYWPYSEDWDGEALPVITFDPENEADANMGYKIISDRNGMRVEEVVVDEKMAQSRPVWVINRNSDSGYLTAEVIRRDYPEWEEGGSIIVRPTKTSAPVPVRPRSRSLVMKDFTMLRQFDSWFSGGSEFFVKLGGLDDFTATTEAEMKLYSPFVTDMLVVVKRRQVGEPIPLNTVMVANYTEQMTHCALMINEDDGGTRTTWKCVALVRIDSRSYGVEITIPINASDDIVWRGQLDQNYLMAHNHQNGRFGDVRITFGIEEY